MTRHGRREGGVSNRVDVDAEELLYHANELAAVAEAVGSEGRFWDSQASILAAVNFLKAQLGFCPECNGSMPCECVL